MDFDSLSLNIARPSLWAVTLASVALYLIYGLSVAIYNIYFHPLAKIPGPIWRRAFYFPEYWHVVAGTTVPATKKLHDKYGPVVRYAPGYLSFTTAQAWKDIYGTRAGKGQIPKDHHFFRRGPGQNPSIIGSTTFPLLLVFADNLRISVSDDADHSRIRKLLAHAFSDAALREQEPLINDYFELLIQKLQEEVDGPNKGHVDMVRWYNFTTFDIIGDLSLGNSFGALEAREYHVWITGILDFIRSSRFFRLGYLYPLIGMAIKALPTLNPNFMKERRTLLNYTKLATEERLATKTDRKDFMTYIQRHNDERGMSTPEILGTSNLLLVAGSETTASLLSGATWHLLRNPTVLAKVRDEVRSAFSSPEEMTFVSTGQLPYLHAVLEESLRTFPPVPANLPRRTIKGEVIDGIVVPPNTSVGVHQWSTHYSSANFANPQIFAPERWLENPPEIYKNDDRAAMQPFSTGPRNCLGKNLAYSEMRSILARMLWHFDMELCAESKDWLPKKAYLVWAKPPLHVKLSHREKKGF